MANVAITPDQDVVTAEIFIAAPPARVLQAITDPNQMPLGQIVHRSLCISNYGCLRLYIF